jgi:hypothetical protein
MDQRRRLGTSEKPIRFSPVSTSSEGAGFRKRRIIDLAALPHSVRKAYGFPDSDEKVRGYASDKGVAFR